LYKCEDDERRARGKSKRKGVLGAEAVECSALSFEGVDDIQRGDCFPFGVFSVSDRIPDNIFEEDLGEASKQVSRDTSRWVGAVEMQTFRTPRVSS
jgi:hypothetical protein